MKKLPVFLLLLLLFSHPAYADDLSSVRFGNAVYQEAQGEDRERAMKQLQLVRRLYEDNIHGEKIIDVCLADNQVAVWFHGKGDAQNMYDNSGNILYTYQFDSIINVYDMNGQFQYGYAIDFDRENPYTALSYDQGMFLVYYRIVNTVYGLVPYGEEILCYSLPMDRMLCDNVEIIKNFTDYTLVSSDNCRLVLSDAEGNEHTLFDHSDEYVSVGESKKDYHIGLAVKAAAGLLIIFVFIEKYRSDKKYAAALSKNKK